MIDTMPARLSRAIRAPGRSGADLDEVKKLLAQDPGLVNQIDPWEQYPLTNAASGGDVEAVKWLLSAGALVNAEGKNGTALHIIASRHELGKPADVVKLLLASGADVHARDSKSRTPLHLAVTDRTKVELEMVRAMIHAGADVNAVDGLTKTVLMTASVRASPAIIKELIAAGANENAVCRRGTPLALAAENDRADNVAILLESGADAGFRFAADFENPELAGRTALDVARAAKAKKVIALLEENAKKPLHAPASASTVTESWKKIETWLMANSPELHASLHPPARDEDIAALEKAIRNTLPEDFKTSWRVHNGNADGSLSLLPPDDSPDDIYGNSESPGGYYLLNCAEVVREWQSWKGLVDRGEFAEKSSGPDGGIQDSWWHPGWIPFASNGGGDSICLDLSPAADGVVGQIITMSHETSGRRLLARSFTQWLDALAGMMGQPRGR